MKYNLDDLYKNKLKNLKIDTPKNSWNKISNTLIQKSIIKTSITTATMICIAIIITTSVFIAKNNKLPIEKPQNYKLNITNKLKTDNHNSNNTNPQISTTYTTSHVATNHNNQQIKNTPPQTQKDTNQTISNNTHQTTHPNTLKRKNEKITPSKITNTPTTIVATTTEHPKANFNSPEKLKINEETIFENTSENATKFEWYVNKKLISKNKNILYKNNKPGNYTIKLIAKNNLKNTDTLEKNLIITPPTANIIFPNAIIPNTYGTNGGYYNSKSQKNDIFHPIVIDKEIEKYTLKIFNRNGELIFQSNEINKGWDGYQHNKLVPIGVYLFTAIGTFSDGKKFAEQGNITVIYDK